MQQFATVSLSPLAIAWLINANDWDHLERLIHINCTLLGGYHNVLIPIAEDGKLSRVSEAFLALYDPDYVILAPGIDRFCKPEPPFVPNPYQVFPWDHASQIIPDSAKGSSNTQAAPIAFRRGHSVDNEGPVAMDLVAVADTSFSNASRLALVACGDVVPAEHEWNSIDGEVSFDASGYREETLQRVAAVGRSKLFARLGPGDTIIPAPTRCQLASLIKEENKFPLTGARDILEACCDLQHFGSGRPSFIGRTKNYTGSPIRKFAAIRETPGMVILVSDDFSFGEAILFGNLRASQVTACWISFSDLKEDLRDIVDWLESDLGASFYTLGQTIAFSARDDDRGRLSEMFDLLSKERQANFPEWRTCDYRELIFYDYERPYVQRSHRSIIREANSCSFLPEYPRDTHGTLGLTIEWPTLMLPPERCVADLVSSDSIHPSAVFHVASGRIDAPPNRPRFRINASRYARVQVDDQSPVQFVVPSINKVLTALFQQAGFHDFREASHAQYQHAFINRSGAFEKACHFLQTPPYCELLKLLSNNSDSNQPGWLIGRTKQGKQDIGVPRESEEARDKNPDARRAIHHLDLLRFLETPDKLFPKDTEGYLRIAESLQHEVTELLELQLLERGFRLRCSSCSHDPWYRSDDVGQVFRCQRCYQEQRVISNPMWFYKLPEVIFQGFKTHMEVPLLALYNLQRRSRHQHAFQYVLDSELFWRPDRKDKKKNVDLCCLQDGRVYIGEAKCNDSIEPDQFAFYEHLASRVHIDGIVFATSKTHWKPNTLERIEGLGSKFKGAVIALTKSQLYDLARPRRCRRHARVPSLGVCAIVGKPFL